MKKFLFKLLHFELYETKAMEDYLEDMALKGWRLTNSGFEKIEPQKLTYSVEVFKETSIEKTDKFIQDCKDRGWEFVKCTDNRIIFVAESENYKPIIRDEYIKYSTIKNGVVKENRLLWISSILLIILEIIFSENIIEYSYNYNLLTGSIITMFISVVSVYKITEFLIWCRQSKSYLKKGEPLKQRESKYVKTKLIIFHSVIVVILVFIVCLDIDTCVNNRYIASKYPKILTLPLYLILFVIISRLKYNKIPTFFCILGIAFCFSFCSMFLECLDFSFQETNENPINFEEIADVESVYDENKVQSTFLAEHGEYSNTCYFNVTNKRVDVDYNIFRSKIGFLKDKYVSDNIFDNYAAGDKSAWGANAVYKNKDSGELMVVYDEVVFVYNGDLQFDNDDISYIRDALGVT